MGQVIYPKWRKVLPAKKKEVEASAPFRFISTQRGCRVIVSKYLSSEQMMQLSYEVFLKAREMESRGSGSPDPRDQKH
jgi:hypothetical protein